jgi:hypothetical protein
VKGAHGLVGTVVRGIHARMLLSLGSLLLTALAVGSAVLGPMFQVAATNSYVVARLAEEPHLLTGLTWTFEPAGSLATDPEAAASQAVDVIDARTSAAFSTPTTSLVTRRFDALDGRVRLEARAGACDHLVVEGRCPSAPGEVAMLPIDIERAGLQVGDIVQLGQQGWPTLTLVGSYSVPAGEEDFWFDTARLTSIPEGRDGELPYQPAPLIVAPSTFDELPAGAWGVRVDTRMDAAPGLTPDQLDDAVQSAGALRPRPVAVDGGRITGSIGNALGPIAAEIRDQQETARLTIAPAVISLVLVALTLLLRLLMAASELRRPELALASLRGLSSRRMWALGLSEPTAILIVAAPLGAVLGVGATAVLSRLWLVPGLPLSVPWASVAAAVVVVLASAAIAVLAVRQVLRQSLSTQLMEVRRPAAAGRARLVAEFVVIAAAVTALISELAAGDRGRPDATDLLLPILLAVTAGLLATRFTAGGARWWTRQRRSGRTLPGFMAARVISRRHEGTLVILPVTAAIAVGVFAGGIYESAASWRASAAATTAPAAEVWTSTLPMNETVALTREIDPEGEYVMAASTLLDGEAAVTILDATRLERVAIWPEQWAPGLSASDVQDLIAPDALSPALTGKTIRLTATNDLEASDDVYVQLRLESNDGDTHSAFLGPFAAGTSTRQAAVPDCVESCRLTGLSIGGPAVQPMQMSGGVSFSDLTADGAEVADFARAGWVDESQPDEQNALTDVSASDGVLTVTADSRGDVGAVRLGSGDVPTYRPVLVGLQAGDGIEQGDGGAEMRLASAGVVLVDPVRNVESMPFLGPGGILIDYSMFTRDDKLTDSLTRVYVLARSDTPEDVRQAMSDRGLYESTTFDDVRSTLDLGAYALALSLYAVVAVLVLGMAVAGLAVSTAVQLPARRRDAASLRVVGVRRRSILSSVGWEFFVVLGGATVAGVAAGALAQYVVLRTVTLGYADDASTPRVVADLDWQQLAVVAVVAVLALGMASVLSAGLTVRGARGSTLRETAR